MRKLEEWVRRVAVEGLEMSLNHNRTVKPFGSQLEKGKVEDTARDELTSMH